MCAKLRLRAWTIELDARAAPGGAAWMRIAHWLGVPGAEDGANLEAGRVHQTGEGFCGRILL